MPLRTVYSSIFSVEGTRAEKRQKRLLQRVETAFLQKRWGTAAIELRRFKPIPDYVILPGDLLVGAEIEGSFEIYTQLNNYVILRRLK